MTPVEQAPWYVVPSMILLSVLEDLIQEIAGNAFLSILLVASLVILAFKVFRKAKRTARS